MSTRRRFPGSRVSVPDGRDVSLSRRRPQGNFHGGDAHQQPGAPGPRSVRPAPPCSSRVVCVCEQGDWSTGHRVPCCAGEAEAGRVRPPPSPLVLSLPPIAPSGPRDTALVGVSLVSGSAVASLPSCLPAPLDIRLTVSGKRGGGRPAVPTSRYQGAPSRLCCREPKLSRTVSGAVLGRPHLCRPRKGRSHEDHVP